MKTQAEKLLEDMAARLGLQVQSSTEGPRAFGRVGGLDVELRAVSRAVARYVVTVHGRGIPQGVGFEREPGAVDGEDMDVGVPEFDDAVRIVCRRRAEVLAVLDAETREQLMGWVNRGFKLRDGLGIIPVDMPFLATATVSGIVALMKRLALDKRALSVRLWENFEKEKRAGVRIQTLLALLEDFPNFPETKASCQGSDPDPAVRLLQGVGLRDGEGVRRAAAELTDPRQARKVLLHVVSPVFPLPSAMAGVLVRAFLAHRIVEIQLAALEVSAFHKLAEVVPSVVELGRQTGDRRVLLSVVQCLERLGDDRAEEFLIGLLQPTGDEVALAAVKALGTLGTSKAVEPLAKLKSWRTFLGQAAEAAILRIQTRIGAERAGDVALADPSEKEGAVSLAADGGELSDAERA